MTEEKDFSWSRFWKARKEVRKQYKDIYCLPIKKKLFQIVSEEIKDTSSILEVGAGEKILKKKVEETYPSVTYKTMDIDVEGDHDYTKLETIEEKFDVIVMAEVIEHLFFEEGLNIFQDLHYLLKEGGKLIVTTPNIYHPNTWFKDSDHRVALSYEVLGAMAKETEFEIHEIYRTFNDSFFKRFTKMYITKFIFKHLELDFAPSIVLVAKR